MIESVLDTFAQGCVTVGINCGPSSRRIALPPSGSGKTSHLQPPLAEINNAVQSRFVVGQLAFMNDQSSLVFALQAPAE